MKNPFNSERAEAAKKAWVAFWNREMSPFVFFPLLAIGLVAVVVIVKLLGGSL